MKFSNEAMRDVLMFLEENIKYERYGTFEDKRKTFFSISMIVNNDYFSKLFSKHKYSKDELQYTIEKMIEGRIISISGSLNKKYQITDITFNGIQLLEKIRPETTWTKIKSAMKHTGIHTIEFIESVAHDVAVESAKQAVTIMMTPK